MRWLRLRSNEITDILPLASLPDIEELWLQDNRISDISPLVANEGLAAGDKVYLDGNPLDEASVNDFIPQLQRRGVEVSW